MKGLLLIMLPIFLILIGCTKEDDNGDKALEVLQLKAKIENLTKECNALKLEILELEERLENVSGDRWTTLLNEINRKVRECDRKEKEIEELQKRIDELLAYSSPRPSVYLQA